MNDYIIDKLTKLLIQEDFKEKQTGKKCYVPKVEAYKDLIKLFKEHKIASTKNV